MSFSLLCVLTLLDGALMGHHAAIGINPCLRKAAFWRRAVLRGLLAGLASLATIAAATGAPFALGADRANLLSDCARAAEAMLWVIVPYTLAILAALGFYLTPRKVLANILVLGPFTLLRTPMLAVAVLAGVARSPRWEVAAILAVATATTLAVKPWLRGHPPAW